jgi:peptide/nickel transport system permease protein
MINNIFKRWQTLLAVFLVLAIILIAIFAEIIAPPDTKTTGGIRIIGNAGDSIPHPPDSIARLGTSPGQIDIFYTLIYGTRDALIFGLITSVCTALIGITIGAISGMGKGWINQLGMRFTDGVMCIPVIVGIAFVQQIIDTSRMVQEGSVQMFLAVPFSVNEIQTSAGESFLTRINPVMIALILLCWVPYARTLNVLILNTKRMEYVTAARALGASTWRSFFRHILPNTLSPLIVLVSKDIGQMVVLQSTFAFVGFTGMSVWTTPLLVSRSWIIGFGGNPFVFWWVYLPITLAIILFAFAWNLLGDEINHWLDPRKT